MEITGSSYLPKNCIAIPMPIGRLLHKKEKENVIS